MAERTGLEPATPCVTGRYSNRLNYRSALCSVGNEANITDCLTLRQRFFSSFESFAAKIAQVAIFSAFYRYLCPPETASALFLHQLNPWFTKMYGFHLLKIGNLSAEINCEACAVSHQVNVSAQGLPVQVQADPLHLPFADKSVDVCLLAHTLPWCTDPHRLLCEADRVLIDDGWLVISGFNPISLMGLRKLVPVLRKTSPYNSRMFTLMRQLDWLSLLNFEVLHASRFHVLPWNKHGGKLLNAHIPALGCLQLIVARKRTIPLTLNPMKQSKNKPRIRQAVGATRQCRKPQA